MQAGEGILSVLALHSGALIFSVVSNKNFENEKTGLLPEGFFADFQFTPRVVILLLPYKKNNMGKIRK